MIPTTTSIVTKDLMTSFTATIEKYEQKNLPELLLGSNITPAKFKQTVIMELKKSEKLQQAFLVNPASLFASILTCAELNLSPSQMLGQFYFIPYKDTITGILGYKGLVALLMRSSRVKKIWSDVVYEGDDFDYELGLEPRMVHIPNHNAERTAKNIKFVYCCIKIDDEVSFKVMSKKEIESVVAMAKYPNKLYFNDKENPNRWLEQKTVLKQLSKLISLEDDRLNKAVSLDDNIEGGGYLVLDDNDNVKLVQGTIINKKSNIYDRLLSNTNNTPNATIQI